MIKQGFPSQAAPFVDASGRLTQVGYLLLNAFFDRTGGAQGVDTVVVQQMAATAQQTAQDASDATLLGLDEGRFNALQQAAAPVAPALDTSLLSGIDEGRFYALQTALASLPDPGLTALLLSDAR